MRTPYINSCHYTTGSLWKSIVMRALLSISLVVLLAIYHANAAELLSGKTFTPLKIFKSLHREPPPPPTSVLNLKAVDTDWFLTRLDHFDSTNNKTWYMRYMTNDEHYAPGGPLFIFVGAEWEITPGWITTGHTYDMARHHNGYLVYTEHRYYGASRPTSDASFENLKWLNVDQALADLAEFIKWFKAKTPGLENSKVILTGASYGGTMAVWMRQRYPEIVTGSWASSAPLFAKVDFFEYKEVMGKAYRQIGSQYCYDRIQEAFAEMEHLVAIGDVRKIEYQLRTCDKIDVNNTLDIQNLFSSLGNMLGGVVQGHRPGDIEFLCSTVTSKDYPDAMTGLNQYIRWQFGSYCFGFKYADVVEFYKNEQWGSGGEIWRQWYYQTCQEFGYYQSSTSKDQPFGKSFPVEFYTKMCADAYDSSLTDEKIEKNIQNTNRKYGALDPQVKNVFFTHGDIDPWHVLGIREDYNQWSPAMVVKNHAHCTDLYSLSDSDTDEMKTLKWKVWELVNQWIRE